MLSDWLLVFSILGVSRCSKVLEFPPDFRFGVATSAYQTEGAWNLNGKGESIWDRFLHTQPERDSGDIACDSYRQWERDIEMVQELGVNFYRFSISWSRIYPKGLPFHKNTEGVLHYSRMIDRLLEKGIEPVVTLYHWDLPQKLQDLGGWANPMVADWFADYARTMFKLYGDRVKTWITMNEPAVFCYLPYQRATMAPGILNPDVGSMLCAKHVLLAHAKAWRIYDEEFRPKYFGQISLTNYAVWFEPATEYDKNITELAQQYVSGIYSHPIFSSQGGWPPAVEDALKAYSKAHNYPRSVLPVLTQKEIDLIKGTYDFYGLNMYTSRVVRKANGNDVLKPFPEDAPHLGAKFMTDPTWEPTAFFVYPQNAEGIRNQLDWLRKEYGNQRFIILENGYSSRGGLSDKNRIQFFKDHLEQVLLAITEDKINVTGYTAWSLMDNIEWDTGYRVKFGLYEVDFSSPARTRTPRASASFYRNVINNRSLDVMYEDDFVQATTVPQVDNNKSIYIGIFSVILIALICFVVYRLNRRRLRSSNSSKDTQYIGVNNDELS